MTDILVSMEDRYLYYVNWLHGSVNQYDITDPSQPRQTRQVWDRGTE